MRHRSKTHRLITSTFLCAGLVLAHTTALVAQEDRSAEPRELTGESAVADGTRAKTAQDDATMDLEVPAARDGEARPVRSEDGKLRVDPALAGLPVLDEALRLRAAELPSGELLRVIVSLRHLPHAQITEQVRAIHSEELESIASRIKAVTARMNEGRQTDLPRDQDNADALVRTLPQDVAELRELNEQHEELSAIIATEIATVLRAELTPGHDAMRSEIESLGGEFEFSTLAGNAVISRVPAGSLEALAAHPDVLRVVEDKLMEGHLDIADEATLVTSSMTGGGLRDNGFTGGIYDPAVIDSGIDLGHPGMQNNGDRGNWYSWYLVAGVAHPFFGETCCTIDDLQGHGTHVAGIVGSYGTVDFPNHLGMADGVDKFVHLKAGWLNSSTGGASMFWSDKYNIVDRALYDTDALAPAATFLDDVDGMNLSYGGSTSLDDTDGSRFWDSVVSTYPDLPVTISAGNTGPVNPQFSDPAVSYNAITVANVQDQGTADRSDDTIRPSSTRGPTAGGRRKPDIASTGTSISSANTFWEGGASDYVNKTGTSMSAPMVLGVAIDLMDAGVTDELEIKALLINTAQKNEPGIGIEGDADGWDTGVGWGLMNAWAAYFHRTDVRKSTVTPNDTPGEYRLWKGQMRDEGPSGEGRDRATMVWNRHATYNTAAPPATFYSLSDLNLRLYDESNNFLIDTDLTGPDNVQQVRIGAGAPVTDVIVKTYAWSTSFDHGGATESFALATEENFVEVGFPTTFQAIAIWPTEVEPNEEFDYEFWIRNDSAIASHNNTFNLSLPAGWTLISGSDTVNVGSAAAGGNTAHYTWRLRAQGTVQDGVSITVAHTHSSYLEDYGPFNWNAGLNVRVDSTPPNPNPMTFSTPPFGASMSEVSMTASFATDLHGPVEYFLEFTGSPTGGSGGSNSGWQPSRNYTDAALQINNAYCYRAYARDSAVAQNLTNPSASFCAYTFAAPPGAAAYTDIGARRVTVNWTANGNPAGTEYLVENLTLGTNSGWLTGTSWVASGLSPDTTYDFQVKARNGDLVQTVATALGPVHTLTAAIFSDGFESGDTSAWSVVVE